MIETGGIANTFLCQEILDVHSLYFLAISFEKPGVNSISS